MKQKSQFTKTVIQTILIIVLIVLINLLAGKFYTFMDLTEDRRFTLEKSTVNLLKDLDDVIFIEVLLEGNMTSSHMRLKNRTTEILKEFNSENKNIVYKFINPSEGTVEVQNTIKKNLEKDGIYPLTLQILESDQMVQKTIYPYAIVKYGERKIAVNLLEPISRGETADQASSRSESLLEYKLASAINKIYSTKLPVIAFTEGNGEMPEDQTAKLTMELGQSMDVQRINLDSSFQVNPAIDVLIVADPTEPISSKQQFKIDQYLMQGGKVIWLIDQFHVNIDSINRNGIYIPKQVENGLEPLLFKYGIRINKDLILDLENTTIPQVIGVQGGGEQKKDFPWVYHPLLQANLESPIVKKIDRVSSTFPSSIDILKAQEGLEISPLLISSEASRRQVYPMRLSFEVLKLGPNTQAYNKPNFVAAALLEGTFQSFFKNRVTEEFNEGLKKINTPFKESSVPTAQVVITDPDIIKNLYNPRNQTISPIGFNKWDNKPYQGNRDFIINVIDYLIDDYGLMDARSKSSKLRLLNQVELTDHKLKWQLINLVLPLLMVVLFGVLYGYRRKRKYS